RLHRFNDFYGNLTSFTKKYGGALARANNGRHYTNQTDNDPVGQKNSW
ncbi:25340_t:CDS:2, partial [Racocetra persica]